MLTKRFDLIFFFELTNTNLVDILWDDVAAKSTQDIVG